jgi:hypothetical protein
MTARSMTFSSSRMFPGQPWARSRIMASRETAGGGVPGRAFLASSSATSDGSSVTRSRRGGTV